MVPSRDKNTGGVGSAFTVRLTEGRSLAAPRSADKAGESRRDSHADLQAQLRRAKARYRSIFDNALEGIFQTTASGRYINANPALARIYGYESPAALIASLTDIARELYVEPTRREDFARLLRERDTVEGFESQVYRRDGRIIWIVENARAVRDHDGTLLYYEGTVEDITARKEAQQALLRSQREIEDNARTSAALVRVGREIISALDTPTVVDRICHLSTEVMSCDCSYTLLRDGGSAEYRVVAAHGFGREEIESLRVVRVPAPALDELLTPFQSADAVAFDPGDDPGCWLTQLAQTYGITAGVHVALRRGDEIIGIHGAAYRGAAEPMSTGVLRIAAGIAQLTSLALENARLVEQLERASALKSDFVATMSHELRTPLNVILGYSELLRDGAFGSVAAEQAEALRSLDRHAGQLLELINTTLDLGRLDAGRLPVEISEVETAELLAEVTAESGSLPNADRLQIRWEVMPDLPPLHSDRLKLRVILKNLINNAVKFTPAGEVVVSATRRAAGVEIAVRDTGIGIAPESMAIIFEAFRQGDSSPTRQFDGAGLGLYIVRRLVEVLGGTITVESTPGRGSVFRLGLP